MNKKQKEKFNQLLIEAGLKTATSTKILHILDQALIKPAPKPKQLRYKPNTPLLTLQEWETAQGKRLDARQLLNWIDAKQYDLGIMVHLVEEFRTDMLSKGKAYADFRAAFQNYFNKL